MHDRTAEINEKLWALVSWFFKGKNGYKLDEETKTLHVGISPQKVFTGTSLRAREYVLGKTITLTSSIIRNVINEIFWRGIPDSGTVVIECLGEPCGIAFYRVKVTSSGDYFGTYYYAFIGKSGERIIADDECRKIMGLPVLHFDTGFEIYGERDGISKPKPSHELDKLLDTALVIRQFATENECARREEISRITESASVQKNALTRDIQHGRREVKQLETDLNNSKNIADRVKLEKRKTAAIKELKIREQSVFLSEAKITAETERKIAEITADLEAKVTRLFAIRI